jgi:hypothetical protein
VCTGPARADNAHASSARTFDEEFVMTLNIQPEPSAPAVTWPCDVCQQPLHWGGDQEAHWQSHLTRHPEWPVCCIICRLAVRVGMFALHICEHQAEACLQRWGWGYRMIRSRLGADGVVYDQELAVEAETPALLAEIERAFEDAMRRGIVDAELRLTPEQLRAYPEIARAVSDGPWFVRQID